MMISKLWNNFTAAPHRVMFFGGALQSLAVMLWWMTEQVMRYGIIGHPLIWTIAPSAALFAGLLATACRWAKGLSR